MPTNASFLFISITQKLKIVNMIFRKVTHMINYKIPDSYYSLNDDQKTAFDMLLYGLNSNQNFFITGDAGVGKSYLIDVYSEFCYKNNINIIKTAFTGTAANNIHGATLHKTFKLPLSVLTKEISSSQSINIQSMLQYTDVIFIDEISMVRMNQIKEANKLRDKKNKNPIQIIISGDFCQLKPVVTAEDRRIYAELTNLEIGTGCCYTSNEWLNCDFKIIELTTPMRQADQNFCNALNNIKIGLKSSIDYLNQNSAPDPIENGIWLCGYKDTAAQKNALGIYNLPGELYESEAEVFGKANIKHTNLAEKLIYKLNARVMMLRNEGLTYSNGSLGTIVNILSRNEVMIQLDNGHLARVQKVKTTFHEYKVQNNIITPVEIGSITQFPFKIGYAVTIHKAQGQTYDRMNLVPEIFTPGQLYVALSRCKNLSNIYIQPDKYGQKITEQKIIPDKDTIKFLIEQNAKAQEYRDWFAKIT